jgi:hypothetical protein
MARNKVRGKASSPNVAGSAARNVAPLGAQPASRALRPSLNRKLDAALWLQELQLRPELVAGIELGELITPEPLRRRGRWVVRSRDLLSFHLELINLRPRAVAGEGEDGAAVLEKFGTGAARIALHFAPQAIAERVFFAASPKIPSEQDGHVDETTAMPPPSTPPTPLEPLAPPPIATRIAYPSRLVFEFDDDKLRAADCWPVPYTTAGILKACRALNLNVTANARYQPLVRVVKNPPWKKALASDVRSAYAVMTVADKAAVLASAQRNDRLARSLGAQATAVLLRRGELDHAAAEPDFTHVAPAQTIDTAGAAQRTAAAGAPAAAQAKAEQRYLPTSAAALALSNSLEALVDVGAALKPYRTVPRPRKPAITDTAVELPFRLLISPNAQARFTHDLQPTTSAATGHTGLWHTRLAEKAEADSGIHRPLDEPIRAIWARGGPESDPTRFTDHWPALPDSPGADTKPFKLFRQTLDDRDRYNIAHLSGNFALLGGRHEAVDCQRLMLSSLGGWLDSRGDWKVPNGLSVEQWVHHAAQARDHYVRVIYKGYCLPFGHRVSLVKISERFFLKDQPGNAAYVLQRMFFIVREPVRSFPETTLFKMVGGKKQYHHRAFPFPVVRLITEVTPDIADPINTQINSQGQAMFWPSIPKSGGGQEPFRFQYVATDLDGNQIHFDLPAIFIDNMLANPAVGNGLANFQLAQQDWLAAANEPWRTATLNRQKVALAPSAKPGDTANEIERIEFGAETEGLLGKVASPLMRPSIVKSVARQITIGALTGGDGNSTVRYDEGFLAQASGYGAGEVYAKIDTGGQGLDFKSCGNKSGGFVQPSLAPSGLSRKKGPVSGNLADVASGQFKPTDFFSQLSPLLFGCIPLGELIKEIAGAAGFDEMPSFITEALKEGEALFSHLGQLDKIDDVIVGMVRNAAQAAIQQAIELAFEQVSQQLSVLDATTAALQTQAQAVATAANGVATSFAGAGDALLSNPAQVQAAIAPALNALQALATALFNRNNVLSVPGAEGLSASTLQVVRQQIALVQQRITQVQNTLADFARIPAVVTAAKDVFAKLTPILVPPDQLKTLIENGQLGPLLTALNGALGGFGTALSALKLIDGAAKQSLLGVIKTLGDVLSAVDKLLPILESLLGDEITVRFAFNPTLAPWPPATGHPLSALGALFNPHDTKGFVVAVEAKVKKSGGAPTVTVRCALTHFDLNLLGNKDAGFIKLEFEKIEFTADASMKTNVDVGFSGIHFIGVLSFVEALRDLIPLDGFSDPPALTIDEHGIDANFSVALPSLAVGVMNLSNLSLGAGFTVPFIGQPLAVRFNFCSREAPFNLTVSLFGGGGFFGITIDPHGVQVLEASFEFGAAIAIDFGVASGGVHVMAGIYFRMEPEKAQLTGYFRLGGYVDVLGLISASIELYMDLTYIFEEGKCIGHASLTIEVHVLFFSASVSISCERKFAGSSGDPSFAALVGPAEGVVITPQTLYPWREYCEAFA